jgi:hypothetical protein
MELTQVQYTTDKYKIQTQGLTRLITKNSSTEHLDVQCDELLSKSSNTGRQSKKEIQVH